MTTIETLITDAVLTIGASIELSLTAKATLLLAIGLLSTRLLAAAPASLRHVLLACTFMMLLALPIAAALMP